MNAPGETAGAPQPPEVGLPERAASPSATLSAEDAALVAEARQPHYCEVDNGERSSNGDLHERLAARLEAVLGERESDRKGLAWYEDQLRAVLSQLHR